MSSRTSVYQCLAVLCIGLVHSALLPAQVCLGCATLFRAQGCSSNPNLLCRLIALKLTFDVGGNPLCDQRPCEGYGQSGSSCVGLFGCTAANIDPNGICDGLQVCCRNSGIASNESIENGNQSAQSEMDVSGLDIASGLIV